MSAVKVQSVKARDLLPLISELWMSTLSKDAVQGPARIGVCVSGGPDSMALAHLLEQIPQEDRNIRIKPVGFIVNHNARPHSSREAGFVRAQLEKHGIESHILTMYWPEGVVPMELPDFEMLARHHRYQLIAKAALRGKVRHLFLGHHLDDQVETIIMRLVRNSGHSFLGLKGMLKNSAIPCCEDIRGANEAIKYQSIEKYISQKPAPKRDLWQEPIDINRGKPVSVSQSTGLQLHRPLLEYTKSQLIATCKENAIKYITDETNFDPTLTMRNAIRYLKTRHRLPRALKSPSLLHLAETARKNSESLEQRGADLASKVQILTFDLRSGLMVIKVPREFPPLCKDDPEAAANALSRLTAVISPQKKADTPTLVPKDRLESFIDLLSSAGEESLMMQQVKLDKLLNAPGMHANESVWRMSRPPMRSAEIKATRRIFEPDLEIPKKVKFGVWSHWILWDHRYWIRVRSANATKIGDIGIRNLQEHDMHSVREALDKADVQDFEDMLWEAAPAKIRYTLPVLTHKGKLSIFPTLNVMVQKSSGTDVKSRLKRHPILEWEVCYKVIDQPFIQSQKSQIIWKNAQTERRTPEPQRDEPVTKTE